MPFEDIGILPSSKVLIAAPKDAYELQDVPGSPTLRPRHNHDHVDMSDAAEKVSLDSLHLRPEACHPRHGVMSYTPQEEKAVIKKFDRHLVLFIAFLYMLGFLDRSST